MHSSVKSTAMIEFHFYTDYVPKYHLAMRYVWKKAAIVSTNIEEQKIVRLNATFIHIYKRGRNEYQHETNNISTIVDLWFSFQN